MQPGSFEYTLSHLIDHEFDLSGFHARYKNELEGAPAYDPAVLLKLARNQTPENWNKLPPPTSNVRMGHIPVPGRHPDN